MSHRVRHIGWRNGWGVALVVLLSLCCNARGDAPIETIQDLLKVRGHHDDTTWANEVLAQRHEETFVKLWDQLIHRQDKTQVLREFPFESIQLGSSPKSKALDWQIERLDFAAASQLSREQALKLLDGWESDGYRLIESEWHHSAFHPATDKESARSTVSILLHVYHKQRQERIIVRGNLKIQWQREADDADEGPPAVQHIDASGLYLLRRSGAPAFRRAAIIPYQLKKDRKSPGTIHPIMLHDLNRDGLPEIVVGGFNEVYWNRGDWKFQKSKLCAFPQPHVRAAVFADFDGDGWDDYLCFPLQRPPVLYKGNEQGKFLKTGTSVGITARMTKPSSVTVGDVDGDGDLDVFMGQQKSSYTNGFIPTPYYGADDGYPFYLLLNDGTGQFTDVTEKAGLGEKRGRHVFSSTLVDMDGDHDLDLLLTNDFCGCDYFENDGKGGFTAARDKLHPTPHAFGMSHSFGDYNQDGRLDFIAIGMSSTTARRLDQMGLGRKDFAEYDARRPEMGYGNRLFLNTPDGFRQAPFNNSCARTGWSWGSTTLDFDRDGDQDLYVVNGNTSGKTTKDYCTRFWCHDLYYKPGERPDGPVSQLFGKLAPMFSGNFISWNGYEHNALLMNQDGNDFVNVGFLMGCAYEFDARAAVSGDLDGDGRVDLLVEQKDVRQSKRNLFILKNTWQDDHQWIGFHLRGQGADSHHGASVHLMLDDGTTRTQHCLTGHSVWAQHANTIHFGLGKHAVDSVRITWPSGKETVIKSPKPNQYHQVQP